MGTILTLFACTGVGKVTLASRRPTSVSRCHNLAKRGAELSETAI